MDLVVYEIMVRISGLGRLFLSRLLGGTSI